MDTPPSSTRATPNLQLSGCLPSLHLPFSPLCRLPKRRRTCRHERKHQNNRELEFAVFCIESVAQALGKPSDAVYRSLAGKDGLLHRYIVPSYDVLHTQGKDYIVNDICELMAQQGVLA